MGGAEGVIFALGPAGEAGQAIFLPQRANAIAPAGQDLVRITLVTDIEDQPIVRRVENLVDGNRQLHHPEAGAQMSAGARYRVDHLIAQFAGQLRHVPIVQLSEVGGKIDLIQQGRL